MKKIIYITTIIAAGLLFSACTDKFLDREPIAYNTVDATYISQASAEQAVIGAYSVLCTRELYDKAYYLGFGSIASDDAECGGENTNDQPLLQSIDRMIHYPSDEPWFSDFYGYTYRGIYYCNTAIEKSNDIKVSDLEADTNIINLRIAEMYFLRSYYYFILTQVFGGVPIITSTMDPSDYARPRATIKEVYTQILDDLDNRAIPLLPEKSAQADADIGRANKGAAKALKAKILLYESSYAKFHDLPDERFGAVTQRWGECLAVCEDIEASGEYSLPGLNGETYNTFWDSSYLFPGNTPGYRYVFSLPGDNCDESIFEIQNIRDGLGWTVSRGNYVTVYSTNRQFFASNGTSTALGWGFNLPTQDLYDAFEEGDLRREVTIANAGDSAYTDARPGGIGWWAWDFSRSPTGMSGRKYELAPDEYWAVYANFQDGPMNVRLLRYGDVILMAAEAAFESGDEPTARTYINTIRTRARNGSAVGVPADYTSAITQDEIRNERRIEMALEGQRFFDLARWNMVAQELDGHHLEIGFDISLQEPVSKYDFFPLSAYTVGLNTYLVQYDGWQ